MAISKPELWTACFPATGTLEAAMADYDAQQAERDAVFKKIQPPSNWKLPIYALIQAEDFDDCNQAAIWFTGGALDVVARTDDGRIRVSGAGYYNTIGA